MKRTKQFVLVILLIVLALSIIFIIKDYQVKSATNRQRLAYAALLTETPAGEQALLSCKQSSLQSRKDYPEIIQGKSVEQIKQLILEQEPLC